MAHPWHYPRWRRILMQATLWLVLAGTLGLAALLNHYRFRGHAAPLGPAQTHAGLQVRLPTGWAVKEAPGTLLTVDEPADPARARRLSILKLRTGAFVPPASILLHNRTIQDAVLRQSLAGQEPFEPIHVATWPGVMVGIDPPPGLSVRGGAYKEVIAAAVLPSRQAVIVRLSGQGRVTPADRQLVREVAAGLSVPGEAFPAVQPAGGTVRLHGGIEVPLPDGLIELPEPDPNRVARLLLSGRADQWVSAELIPLLVIDDRPEAIASLLAVQDERWAKARVEDLGPSQQGGRAWRLDYPDDDPAGDPTHVRAYVIAGSEGHGVAVVFHGARGTQPLVETAWSALTAGMRFTADTDTAALLKQGAEDVLSLRQLGLAEVLPEPHEEEWWLWYSETPPHFIGWSHQLIQKGKALGPGSLRIRHETRWRGEQRRRLLRVEQAIEVGATLTDYQWDWTRWESVDDTDDEPWTKVAHQRAIVEGDRLEVRSVQGRDSTPARSAQVGPNYIPGGLLPLVLSHLSRRRMILQTDSFLTVEPMAVPTLLTLIIEPSPQPASAPAATQSATDPSPLRWVSVQINGSGELSRWYYPAHGDELQKIDFPGGLRHVPTTTQQLRRDADDPRLDPE